MKQIRPLYIVLVGAVVLIAGILYEIVFVGIPYQDPTPDLAAPYAHQSAVAYGVRIAGVLLFSLGVALAILRRVSGRRGAA